MCAFVLLAIALAVCGTTSKTSDGPVGSVGGTLEKDCRFGGCDSDLAKDNLQASSVWCTWQRHDVLVHLRLENRLNAHVTASITPRYEIEAGGTHGDSFGSDQDVDVPAAGSTAVTLNAGHPEGVPDGTAISKCNPRLIDINLTNP